jgi:hypothetical protein
MGAVYEAEQDDTGRRVALKLMAPHYGGSAEALDRFRREGQLAGLIAHPRCVFVLAADEDAGRPYLVMELMPGDTLQDLVRRRGPLPPREAVARVLDVIEGLQEVHRLGIVHRDVKPSNCFLDAEGRVKVGDFGLARSLEADTHLTRTGAFVGTPLFAAPEQLKGEAVDPRGDVYAAAATLYYLLTGQAPHEGGDPAAVAARIASESPRSLRVLRPDLPKALDRVVLRGLARQRQRRYRDLEAFRRALLPFAPAGALSIGGMGRRLIALLIDAVVILLPVWGLHTVAEVWLGRALGKQAAQAFFLQHQFLVDSLVAALIVLYFGLLEGLWGWSLGKRLLRLRAYRSSRDAPVGLWRALLRAALFYLLLRLPEALYLLPLDCGTRMVLWLLLSTQAPGALLVMSTMRARNGYRGLHEFLSGTRTVQLPWPARRPRPNALFAPRDVTRLADRLTHPAGLPSAVGPFRVRGAVGDASSAFWLGEDPALRRDVLLWVRAAAGPVTAGRREVGRPTRLRWLTGGIEGAVRWDAFVAPAGRPVSEIVARAGPLPWAEVRPLLAQLTDELTAACADATLPDNLTLAQVLVRPDGAIELLDAPPEGAGAAQKSCATDDEHAVALLRDFAVVTLEGKPRPTGGETAPVRRPLPLHAAAVLAELFGTPSTTASLDGFRRRLTAVLDRPARVTRVARALHLLVQGVLLLVALGVDVVTENLLHLHWVGPPLAPLVLIGVSLAWAFLLRGGPSFPMAGLALVRADGRRAARWQAAWRSVLVWAQWVVPVTTFTFLHWWHGGRLANQSPIQFQGDEAQQFLAAFALWIILAVWLPRRPLHDRLAGTYLVPE